MRHREKGAIATLEPQTGWFRSDHLSKCILATPRLGNAPRLRRFGCWRDIFLLAQPPLLTQEGIPVRIGHRHYQQQLPTAVLLSGQAFDQLDVVTCDIDDHGGLQSIGIR